MKKVIPDGVTFLPRAWPLVLVLMLGAALRIFQLSTVPTELAADEIALYDSAHSIATKGVDIDGTLQPFLYQSFTRNPPMYAIAGYLSTVALGRNAFAWRLPAAIFGILSIVFVHAIAMALTRRRDVAIAAALCQAVSPLFVQFSRIGWEPAAELPFLLGGLLLLLHSIDRAREGATLRRITLSFCASALVLGLTAYTYMAGIFYATLLGGSLLILHVNVVRSRALWLPVLLSLAVYGVVLLPALAMFFGDQSTASRVSHLSTFSGPSFGNDVVIFLKNYVAQFRWSYLVTTGDPVPALTWRYLNGFGAFYAWIVVAAVLGLVRSSRYIRSKPLWVWSLVWLFAYPLGGALTNEGADGMANAPRTLAGAPIICIFAAIGVVAIWTFFKTMAPRYVSVVARGAIVAVVLYSVGAFARYYFTDYVHANSNAWFSGTRALFLSLRAYDGTYRRVCFAVRPAWYDVRAYAGFFFVGTNFEWRDTVTDPACAERGTLLAVDDEHLSVPRGFVRIREIRDVDDNPFAVIYGNR